MTPLHAVQVGNQTEIIDPRSGSEKTQYPGKTGRSRRGALLLHLQWVVNHDWAGNTYCHDRLLVQYLERPGHPRNCARPFIRSATCGRDLQSSWLQRGMWAVRPDDQGDHQRSYGNNFACSKVGEGLKIPGPDTSTRKLGDCAGPRQIFLGFRNFLRS